MLEMLENYSKKLTKKKLKIVNNNYIGKICFAENASKVNKNVYSV